MESSLSSLSNSLLSKTNLLLESIPSALFVFDTEGRITFQNQLASALPGIEGKQLLDLSAFEKAFPFCRPDGQTLLAPDKHPVRLAMRGAVSQSGEFVIRRTNMVPAWVDCEAQAVRSGDTVIGVVLLCRNITERKRREQSTDANNKIQQFIYNENLAGIIHSKVDGRIIYVNDAVVRMLGYDSREDLQSRRVQALYLDVSERETLLRRLAKCGRLDEAEFRLRRKDGSLRWVLGSVRMIDTGVSEIGGDIVSSVIDITERKNWEDSLRSSERRFSEFMRNLPGVAFIKDLEGRYVYYNEASERLFGILPKDILGKTDEDVWPADIAQSYRENDAKVFASGQPVEVLEQVSHGSGIHTWLINKFPIREKNDIVAVGGVGIDVTERLQLEDQLTQARKMEALGRLAGGVAHDFNNLLTVISGYSQLALEGIGTAPADKLSSYVQEILNSSKRAAGLTHQLLAFSRRQNVQLQVLDLSDLVRSMDKMLRRMIGEHVQLHVRCTHEECFVKADVHQLEQVLMNLVVNARDAMPLGGILDIETSVLPLAPQSGRGTGEVLLLVRDTGVGMNEDTRSRLFEPFFTSKEKGKGTGLGLSTVYGIVTQAGGRVEVQSGVGEGACFRIHFPLAQRDPNSGTTHRPASQSITGSETILLVEDELSVRELAREILKRLGYKVLLADSGRAALEIWDKQFGKIDLLLTDVIMPHMSGSELAHRLRERNPRLRVLFMSGYTDDMIASHGALAGGTQLLAKPFTAEALGRKLREVLED